MIENRHTRVEYLLETVKDYAKQDELLWDIIEEMTDREFDVIYELICRSKDVEPDQEKFDETSNEDIPPAQKRSFDTDWQLPNG
jgi:hypothetical protein